MLFLRHIVEIRLYRPAVTRNIVSARHTEIEVAWVQTVRLNPLLTLEKVRPGLTALLDGGDNSPS
jgi:hypothetical protein